MGHHSKDTQNNKHEQNSINGKFLTINHKFILIRQFQFLVLDKQTTYKQQKRNGNGLNQQNTEELQSRNVVTGEQIQVLRITVWRNHTAHIRSNGLHNKSKSQILIIVRRVQHNIRER